MNVHGQLNWTSTPLTHLPPKCGAAWDDEQDETLRKLASEGRSRKEIAQMMHRTPMGIQGRCQAIGVHVRRDSFGGFAPRRYERPMAEDRAAQEARDKRFQRALALSIYKGEHLPCQG